MLFIANLFRQDFPIPGITGQVTAVVNINREDQARTIDDNGFPGAPRACSATLRPRHYDVAYLGYNADGRIGRMNLTASDLSGARRRPQQLLHQGSKAKIRAYLRRGRGSATTINFLRVRLSGLYASGDKQSVRQQGDRASTRSSKTPIFAGADTSYTIRQIDSRSPAVAA